jgi:hypothetical protein
MRRAGQQACPGAEFGAQIRRTNGSVGAKRHDVSTFSNTAGTGTGQNGAIREDIC